MDESLDIVAGKLYKNIKVDPDVLPTLTHCLYCKISHSHSIGEHKFSHKDIDYKIMLDETGTAGIKQCPACKTIFILRDPLEKW